MQVEPEKIRVSCISKVGVAAVLVWNKATSSIVCGLPASRGKLVLVPARESIPLAHDSMRLKAREVGKPCVQCARSTNRVGGSSGKKPKIEQ